MSKTQTTPPEDVTPVEIPTIENVQPQVDEQPPVDISPTEEVKQVQNGLDLIFSMFAEKKATKKNKKQ